MMMMMMMMMMTAFRLTIVGHRLKTKNHPLKAFSLVASSAWAVVEAVVEAAELAEPAEAAVAIPSQKD